MKHITTIVYYICIALSLFHGISERVLAQTRAQLDQNPLDPRGPAELVICSQNLANYGAFNDSQLRTPTLTLPLYERKRNALIKRFVDVGCDVIAVQEILGADLLKAEEALKTLADLLRTSTNRIFELKVGRSNDPVLHNGFLVAKDKADILNTVSYARVELPKISPEQKPRFFTRGPLEIQLLVKGRADANPKTVSVVTFHFKSQSGHQGDPAGLQWETYRMEMGEALRRIVEERHKQSFASGDSLLVLLGDRNSNFDAASAKILEGVIALKHFQNTAPCRLSKRGVPLCQAGVSHSQKLFSVLVNDPQAKLLPGTFRYKNVYSWLDDILMPAASLRSALFDPNIEGNYDSGVQYEPKEASDHALVYVRLNW